MSVPPLFPPNENAVPTPATSTEGGDDAPVQPAVIEEESAEVPVGDPKPATTTPQDYRKAFCDRQNWPRANFMGLDVTDASFRNAILTCADFSYAEGLGTVDFTGADLRMVYFDRTHLRGTKFRKANLKGVNFSRTNSIAGADFTGANLTDVEFGEHHLRGARLRGATLKRQNFGEMDVRDIDFSDCDLTDADLSQVQNLLPHQLSGANLTRCKLPESVGDFSQLANVAELSKNAGKLFSTMIGAVIFVLLITFTTPDLQILASSGKAQIPVLDIEVSTTVFLIVTPGVLLVLYILVHLYLQRLWAMMAQLPAIFPDGITVDAKTYPWLVNDRIRTGFPQLNRKPAPMSWLHVTTFGGIVYGVTPVAILAVYLRCLIRHDWATTGWHILFLSVCLWVLVAFLWFNYITLHRDARWLDTHGNWRRTTQGWLIFVAGSTLIILFALPLHFVANCAFNGVVERGGLIYTKKAQELLAERKKSRSYATIPQLLADLRLTSYGNIPEDKSLRPEKWDDPINSLVEVGKIAGFSDEKYDAFLRKGFFVDKVDAIAQGKPGVAKGLRELAKRRTQEQNQKIDLQVKQANLSHLNLDFLQAPSAFLLNADLRGTSLQFANFQGADLRGALLEKNDFSGADLSFAILTGANLNEATLIGADLGSATLWGANLIKADLTGADLIGATLIGATLTEADLTDADLYMATLTGSDLEKATLTGANLIGANLTGADYLSKAKLNQVVYSSKTKWPKGWKNPPLGYEVVQVSALQLKKIAERGLIDPKEKSLRMLAIIGPDR